MQAEEGRQKDVHNYTGTLQNFNVIELVGSLSRPMSSGYIRDSWGKRSRFYRLLSIEMSMGPIHRRPQ